MYMHCFSGFVCFFSHSMIDMRFFNAICAAASHLTISSTLDIQWFPACLQSLYVHHFVYVPTNPQRNAKPKIDKFKILMDTSK